MSGAGELDDIRRRLGKVEDQVAALSRFQSWLMGIAAGVGAILGVLIEPVRRKIGW